MNKWIIASNKKISSPKELVDQLLENRKISKKSRQDFLEPLKKEIEAKDIGLEIKEIGKSVKRIQESIQKGKTIIVYGDYDVDGITGTALLWETIYKEYKNVMPYIPYRFGEGYGISQKGIDAIVKDYPDVDLIITVDNGIVAHDAVAYAKEKKIDVIVTDHHTKGEKMPDAYSIVHTTEVCGASVAFFLSLSFEGKKLSYEDERLDLIALATVADLVPLTGANRSLLTSGLEVLRKTKRIGLLSLMSEAGIAPARIDVYSIGHVIAPRINASGRIEHGLESLRLLCTKDEKRSKIIAKKLNETNKQRQVLTEESAQHAIELVGSSVTAKVSIAHSDTYNQGIVGLVASKLVEKYHRPSLVISVGEEISKGSARSVNGVNIIELIRSSSKYLLEAGGHPMAAGFSLRTEHLELFKKDIFEKALTVVTDDHLVKKLYIDVHLDFSMITKLTYDMVQKLAPFGMGNYEPLFVTSNVTVREMRIVGKDKKHLQLILEKDGMKVKAIGFGMADGISFHVSDAIDVVYAIRLNEWNGMKSLQLVLKDYKTV